MHVAINIDIYTNESKSINQLMIHANEQINK